MGENQDGHPEPEPDCYGCGRVAAGHGCWCGGGARPDGGDSPGADGRQGRGAGRRGRRRLNHGRQRGRANPAGNRGRPADAAANGAGRRHRRDRRRVRCAGRPAGEPLGHWRRRHDAGAGHQGRGRRHCRPGGYGRRARGGQPGGGAGCGQGHPPQDDRGSHQRRLTGGTAAVRVRAVAAEPGAGQALARRTGCCHRAWHAVWWRHGRRRGRLPGFHGTRPPRRAARAACTSAGPAHAGQPARSARHLPGRHHRPQRRG